MNTESEIKKEKKIMTENYDAFLYQNHPPCPRCKKEMHIAVLSGSSDSTGHTNEYYCEWCPSELNIRVIIKVRDPEAIKAQKDFEKLEKDHPIICKNHFKFWVQSLLRHMQKKPDAHIWFLPVRKP